MLSFFVRLVTLYPLFLLFKIRGCSSICISQALIICEELTLAVALVGLRVVYTCGSSFRTHMQANPRTRIEATCMNITAAAFIVGLPLSIKNKLTLDMTGTQTADFYTGL